MPSPGYPKLAALVVPSHAVVHGNNDTMLPVRGCVCVYVCVCVRA